MQKKSSRSRSQKPQARKPSRGLGDKIEAVTKATGIKAVVDWFSDVTGIDCGCEARKEKLNRLFPGNKPECLTKDEHDFIVHLKTLNQINPDNQKRMNAIYSRVFHTRVEPTSCASCLLNRLDMLNAVALTYKEDGKQT